MLKVSGEFKLKEIFSFCGRHSGSVERDYGEQQTIDLVLTEHPPSLCLGLCFSLKIQKVKIKRELRKAFDGADGFAAVQWDLTRPEKRTCSRYSATSCIWARVTPCATTCWELASSFTEWDLRVQRDKVMVKQQYALVAEAANNILCCVR